MKLRFSIPAILGSSALMFFLACGSSGKKEEPPPAPPVPVMSYTNPTTTGVFSFVKNTSLSTPTHLVLDLVANGQATASGGVAFSVTLNNTDIVKWGKVSATDAQYVQNGTVFNTGTGPAASYVARLEGNQLKVSVGQKGLASLPNLNSGVIARIAVDLLSDASQGNVSLVVNKFQIIPTAGGTVNINPSNVLFGRLSYKAD